ncbi:P-loop containing nucleoside triphosphate hydrolases superfamily protein [Rhynchospora pubera]|uniref:P-loop containing nucleoside triphosphate hydrolases superfamily protein n=1 Tax=Rhynchospora pubera TaxID=906938 RepID=A0AAV8E5P7_9POAL|nr:P-loop containing nucleoside triphosphate hydrolases superfamily protein [Rhynchospora pubera]
MAPVSHTLSLSLLPFSKTLVSKPSLCAFPCRASSTPPPPPPPPAAESEGAGAAAPTRGEVFLEMQRSSAAAAQIMKDYKRQEDYRERKKKRKEKKLVRAKVASNVACCYGCGAPLQIEERDAPGFVEPETYELKKRHHQLKTVLCGRCRLLSHGHMITAVGGHGGYPGGKQFISAEELREKLSHLRRDRVLIVKLVDIVDFNGSFLSRVRDLAGGNPIILVITKVDLLPRDTDLNCVGDWVVQAVVRKKLNVLSVHLTSSKSLVGITGVISAIQNEKKGRDVYILGSANVGKSAFISALLKTMAKNDPAAEAAQKYKPIQSAVPGTTLGPIQIEAFVGGGKLYDTPGVHLHHRQAAVVHANDLTALAPQSRLKPRYYPVPAINGLTRDANNGLNGCSLFWGGLVRIDVIEGPKTTRLTFYGPRRLQISTVPSNEADDFYQKEVGLTLTPPTGKDGSETWPGLEAVRQLQIKYTKQNGPTCDIAISGLGWISVEPFGLPAGEDYDDEEDTGELHLAVHVPKPVEVFMRPPLPVGKGAESWYQYAELSEKEEESRPKWFY